MRQVMMAERLTLPRRRFFACIAGVGAAAVLPHIARAQVYPTRPVRLIVGITAGSAPDLFARIMTDWLSIRLGQQFIVENRPGAGTNIATEAVIRAPADGYTLLLVSAPNTINATLYDKLNFNFLRDIAPVGSIVDSPEFLLVHPSVPVTSVPELISYAKAHPGKLTMASPGVGSGPHMSGELFKSMAGIDMTHVPFRGGAQAMTDLIAGHVQVMFAAPIVANANIKADRLRALAVTTVTPSPILPNVPPIANFLPGYRSGGFFGIGAPRATPSDIVDTLNREINAALLDPAIRSRFAAAGVSMLGGSPAGFARLLAEETEKWAKVIRSAGIKAS